jgi:hypothetical protein
VTELRLRPVAAKDRSKPAGYVRLTPGHYRLGGKALKDGVCSKCRAGKCWGCHSLKCRCGKCHPGEGKQ